MELVGWIASYICGGLGLGLYLRAENGPQPISEWVGALLLWPFFFVCLAGCAIGRLVDWSMRTKL